MLRGAAKATLRTKTKRTNWSDVLAVFDFFPDYYELLLSYCKRPYLKGGRRIGIQPKLDSGFGYNVITYLFIGIYIALSTFK